jgi:hypothetical protein
MGWHTRSIENKCKHCGARATVELYNRYNAPSGYFCKKCGEKEAKRLEAWENEQEAIKQWIKS